MTEDVAGLVKRLGVYAEYVEYDPPLNYEDAAATTMREAASTIRALVAENERLKFGDKQMQGLWAIDREERDKAEAKLREAVEVMRLVQHQPMNLEIRAFLATMEKPHDP